MSKRALLLSTLLVSTSCALRDYDSLGSGSRPTPVQPGDAGVACPPDMTFCEDFEGYQAIADLRPNWSLVTEKLGNLRLERSAVGPGAQGLVARLDPTGRGQNAAATLEKTFDRKRAARCTLDIQVESMGLSDANVFRIYWHDESGDYNVSINNDVRFNGYWMVESWDKAGIAFTTATEHLLSKQPTAGAWVHFDIDVDLTELRVKLTTDGEPSPNVDAALELDPAAHAPPSPIYLSVGAQVAGDDRGWVVRYDNVACAVR